MKGAELPEQWPEEPEEPGPLTENERAVLRALVAEVKQPGRKRGITRIAPGGCWKKREPEWRPDPAKARWVKLRLGNDWETLYLAIDPLNDWGAANADRAYPLQAGETVLVRWPDGSLTLQKVVIRRKYGSWTESARGGGSMSGATLSRLPGVLARKWVRLDGVEIWHDGRPETVAAVKKQREQV